VLSPDEVVRLLEMRRTRLDAEIAANDGILTKMTEQGFPYLWAIEADYAQVLRRAERDFVDTTIETLKKADLPELQAWRRVHESAEGFPNETDWTKALREAGISWE
jgi:hypothetical protein